MAHPGLLLGLFLVLLGLGLLLAWPRFGLVARLRRTAQLTERVHLEDALKHLYHLESRRSPFSIAAMAGVLELSRHRALSVVERLTDLHLATFAGDRLVLTEAGRAYALRILRTHRLWERYLADRTGLAPAEWHEEAERKEHDLSREAAETLAARIGHPVYDPHGDPIPTAAGELPPVVGVPLSRLDPGVRGVVTHLEDEPQAIFDALVRAGMALGQEIEVVASGPRDLEVLVDGMPRRLSALQAGNVTVTPGEGVEHDKRWHRTLADLEVGEEAAVAGIAAGCQGTQRRRLLDLGVVPGTVVRAEMRSAAGDPVAYRIRGALIALRRQQAEWVGVAESPRSDALPGAA